MRRHVSQVLLDFRDFGEGQTGLVRLVVHFEVLDLLQVFLIGPLDSLVAFFLFRNRFFFFNQIISNFFDQIYSRYSGRTFSKISIGVGGVGVRRIGHRSGICRRKLARAFLFFGRSGVLSFNRESLVSHLG